MWRMHLSVLVTLAVFSVACGQNANDAKKAEPARSAAEKRLRDNPNDVQAIMSYIAEVHTAVNRLMQTDADAAREKLDAMEALFKELKIEDPAAKSRISSMQATTKYYRDRIDVQNVSLAELEKALLAKPGDAVAARRFMTKLQFEVGDLARTQPDLAEKKLEAAKEALAKAKEQAGSESARRAIITASSSVIGLLERRISTGRMSLAELGKEATDNPDQMQSLSDFFSKFMAEVPALARSNPEEAKAKIELAREVLSKVESDSTNRSVKSIAASYKRTAESVARSVDAEKKLTEMIGKDAAPLKVEAWVNGSPLSDGDLKGKVVLLDFWAVWCGPCIVTFPHLREWNEKYADKGLVMIGVTNYYKYKWDADAKKAIRSTDGEVTPAEEQEMLVHFAESYELKHRFAIESDKSLSQYYGVTGIPHVVVIDQEGKIRLMKVGSGEANAKEIAAMLEKLLGDKAAGGQ